VALFVAAALPIFGAGFAQAQSVVFQGAITTVASGLSNPDSVAVDASGNVYIADTFNSRVLKETLSGAATSRARSAAGGTVRPALPWIAAATFTSAMPQTTG
jgi:hypothetical protein